MGFSRLAELRKYSVTNGSSTFGSPRIWVHSSVACLFTHLVDARTSRKHLGEVVISTEFVPLLFNGVFSSCQFGRRWTKLFFSTLFVVRGEVHEMFSVSRSRWGSKSGSPWCHFRWLNSLENVVETMAFKSPFTVGFPRSRVFSRERFGVRFGVY